MSIPSSAVSPRQAAKASGAKTYYGSSCKKCGETERRTDNGACLACHRANQIRWKAENPDKVNANARSLRAANIEKFRKQGRERYAENPEPFRQIAREQMKRAREADPEKFRERDRKRYPKEAERRREYSTKYGPQWASKNRDKVRAAARKRYAEDPAKHIERNRSAWPNTYKRTKAGYIARARVRKRLVRTVSPPWLRSSGQLALMNVFYASAPDGMVVDHNIPLAGCRNCGAVGLHILANLQYLTAAINSAKRDRCMECFMTLR